MGFMDKAKKMAEQAQAKLDDVQKEFNSSSGDAPAPSGPLVEYDKHGRPIQPPAEPASPHGDPTAAAAAASAPPPAPPAPPAPAAAAPPPAPPAGPSGPEDRNKTDYTPPKLSSGDPLAGG